MSVELQRFQLREDTVPLDQPTHFLRHNFKLTFARDVSISLNSTTIIFHCESLHCRMLVLYAEVTYST